MIPNDTELRPKFDQYFVQIPKGGQTHLESMWDNSEYSDRPPTNNWQITQFWKDGTYILPALIIAAGNVVPILIDFPN